MAGNEKCGKDAFEHRTVTEISQVTAAYDALQEVQNTKHWFWKESLLETSHII
jgi:hypothetical protein